MRGVRAGRPSCYRDATSATGIKTVKVTTDQIRAALNAAAGNISYAARQLGVNRSTLHRRIAKSAELQTLVEDQREDLVDIAESALRKAVLEGEGWAVIWTLKASPAAKKRGWSERQEITGADGRDVLDLQAVVAIFQGIERVGGETPAD